MKNYILYLTLISGAFVSWSYATNPEAAPVEVSEMAGLTTTLAETRSRLSELSHHNASVLKNYDDLASLLNNAHSKEKSLTEQDIQAICSGIEFAAEKHRLQTRKNAEKTPYISHPLGVTYHLMVIGEVRDVSILLGALLHDTLEGTQTTYAELQDRFGKQTADYVREVTDDKSVGIEMRKRLQIIHAAQKSTGATQIQLADKLYNLYDLLDHPPKDWSRSRIDRYYEWVHSVVKRLPKANDKLLTAVDHAIDVYWENQQKQ